MVLVGLGETQYVVPSASMRPWMRPSPVHTTTMPSATRGGPSTSLVTFDCQSALPPVSNASTSPLSVPTTTSVASAPTPAESLRPASIRHTTAPLAGSTRKMVPLLLAAYMASGVMAGASPGAD